jgi:hypothetical protein
LKEAEKEPEDKKINLELQIIMLSDLLFFCLSVCKKAKKKLAKRCCVQQSN